MNPHPDTGRIYSEGFDDLHVYRSSAEMLRQGVWLLNQYYYDWMTGKYESTTQLSAGQVQLILQIIECLGGVLGFLPCFRPTIPEAKRKRLIYLMNEKWQRDYVQLKRDFEQESRDRHQERQDRIQALKDEIQYLKDYGVKEERWGSESHGTSFGSSGPTFANPIYGPRNWSASRSSSRSTPIVRYLRGTNEDFEKQEKYLKGLHEKILALERSPLRERFPLAFEYSNYLPRTMEDIHTVAIQSGMPMHEVESLVEWEPYPLDGWEKDALITMMAIFAQPPPV